MELIRRGIGGLVVVYLALGPALVQVLGWDSRHLPRWQMFASYGRDVCTFQLWDPTAPEWTRIDRLQALGYDRWTSAPQSERTAENFAEVRRQAQRVCDALDLDDVRIKARCGVDDGWVRVAKGNENACLARTDALAEGRAARFPYERIRP